MSKHDVRQAHWVSEDGGGSGFLPSPVQPVIGVQTDLPGSDTSSLSLLHPWTALPTQTIGESCLSLSCNTGVTDTFTLGLLKVSCCESWIQGGGWWISCSDHLQTEIATISLNDTLDPSRVRARDLWHVLKALRGKLQIAQTLFDLWKTLSLFLRCLCGDLMMKNASSKLWTTLAPNPDWNCSVLSALVFTKGPETEALYQ